MENGGVVACVVVFFFLILLFCAGTGWSNYRTYNQCKRTFRQQYYWCKDYERYKDHNEIPTECAWDDKGCKDYNGNPMGLYSHCKYGDKVFKCCKTGGDFGCFTEGQCNSFLYN